jgi:hypothetical protein
MFAMVLWRAHRAGGPLPEQLHLFDFSIFHCFDCSHDVVAIRSALKLRTVHDAMALLLVRTKAIGVAVEPSFRELFIFIFCFACLLAALNE